MNRERLIQQFCEIVNTGLAQGQALGDAAVSQLAPQLTAGDQALLEELRANFQHAYKPTEFFNQQVLRLDHTFFQCHALMSQSLDADVVDPIESFAERFEASSDPDELAILMWGRFWRVAGAQQYNADGKLLKFDYNQLTASSHIACMINTDYIPFPLPDEPNTAIAGVGQMATRLALRGQGHANNLVQLFEQQVKMMAQQRGQALNLLVLEAERAARPFWARMGYRYPQGARYFQPPLSYDPHTGEPVTRAMPEMIMVKFMDGPMPETIDKDLLIRVVRTLYERWYTPEGLSAAASARVESHLFGTLFADFLSSLPDADTIPLIMPPAD